MAQNKIQPGEAAVQRLYMGENICTVEGEQEFSSIMQNFIYNDVWQQVKMPDAHKELLTLAVLTANNTPEDIAMHTLAALRAGAAPEEICETIYQCAPYIGMPKAKAALKEARSALRQAGALPAEQRAAVTEATRKKAGLNLQRQIFGAENIDKMIANTPQDQKHITDFLSANCFGDYYTRRGLDLKQRELVTFTAIAVLGGCEAQAKAHVAANISVGNTRQDLLNAVTIALPYIGYPRTLNALACINEIVPAKDK